MVSLLFLLQLIAVLLAFVIASHDNGTDIPAAACTTTEGDACKLPIATFYSKGNFTGRALQVTQLGHYDVNYLNYFYFNDIISSMEIAAGYAVQLCYEANFRDCKPTLDAGAHRWFWQSDDKTSSFIVTHPVAILYEDYDYKGRGVVAAGPGEYNQAFLLASNHFNNQASSMMVADRFQILLCYGDNYTDCKGAPDTGNHHQFGYSDNKVSSFIVSILDNDPEE